jgi:hypothetical protein
VVKVQGGIVPHEISVPLSLKQLKQSLLHVTGHKKHLYQAQNLPFRLRQLRLTPTPLLPRLLLLLLLLVLSEIWRQNSVFPVWKLPHRKLFFTNLRCVCRANCLLYR